KPADNPAVAPDREEQGGIPRVVVHPEDARVPTALDDPRRLRDRLRVEPAQVLQGANTRGHPEYDQTREQTRHRRSISSLPRGWARSRSCDRNTPVASSATDR